MTKRATAPRLAGAVLTAGVLAAAAGCGSSGGGTSTGAVPSARTLTSAPADGGGTG
ncbi:MAG: molybdate ABC transporter substrate-binding protein, partial [Actinobacteria bacterium]|nr:molybdate ABC transporter substrate-binding protein [Actinomycetota bacterium]